jgi:hypothetical protein
VKFKLQNKAATKQSAYQKIYFVLRSCFVQNKYVHHTNILSHPTGLAAPPSAGAPPSSVTSDLGKTNTIKSITNNSLQYALSIGYNEEYTEESVNTKFLHSQIDKTRKMEESYSSNDS